MKIGIILSSLSLGGVEKVSVTLANALSHDYDVDLIVLGKDYNYYKLDDFVKLRTANIEYGIMDKVRRKLRRLGRNMFELNYPILFKEESYLQNLFLTERYDILIGSDGYSCIIIEEFLRNYRDRSNLKVISWMHNNYNAYFNIYYKNYQKQLIYALNNSSCIVTLTKSDYEEYKLHNAKTCYIYNPLTLQSSEITNLENKEIIFVGRLLKNQKGLDFIIEIAKKIQHTNWTIRVVGDGKDKLCFQNEVENNNLQKTIILNGKVTENLHKLYANASIFISTSRWEGFGLVITEAMACGLPVVAFENSGPNEILNYGEYGVLIPKYDVDEFANALLRLIENPTELECYSQKSIERANDFSLHKVTQQWKKIFED